MKSRINKRGRLARATPGACKSTERWPQPRVWDGAQNSHFWQVPWSREASAPGLRTALWKHRLALSGSFLQRLDRTGPLRTRTRARLRVRTKHITALRRWQRSQPGAPGLLPGAFRLWLCVPATDLRLRGGGRTTPGRTLALVLLGALPAAQAQEAACQTGGGDRR